ncbi:biopolymer transporter ExbD [Pontibacter sp. SGAir0037]|uniref:ExbD/TolR family protein n=1 Tax=Pontibacter sp. SGAir0037 TaxID=2571030 RepID=UPI0010CD224C|nr:biopolymer transporter ExbD [Pontibacter sp. SGAir0037]QCR24304.1 biopolymer transporter ExbD [Pontibacter sp. SGAir0037]
MAEIQEKADSGGGGKKRAKKMSVHLDMTPMVDLAFLLLTFFMLTTTFNKPQTMEINMPAKADAPEDQTPIKESNALTIILGENNKVFYYYGLGDPAQNPEVVETDFSNNGIRKVLISPRVKSNPKMVVSIKPMETSRYKNVVDILDEMKITDTKKFALVDITANDKQLVQNTTGQ